MLPFGKNALERMRKDLAGAVADATSSLRASVSSPAPAGADGAGGGGGSPASVFASPGASGHGSNAAGSPSPDELSALVLKLKRALARSEAKNRAALEERGDIVAFLREAGVLTAGRASVSVTESAEGGAEGGGGGGGGGGEETEEDEPIALGSLRRP
jgi:hypothetical protein